MRAPVAAGAALAGALLAVGCASGGTPAPAPELRRGVEGTQAVVQHGNPVAEPFPSTSTRMLLAAVSDAYAALGLDVTARVAGSQIASQGHRLVRLAERRASWWVDCGTDFSGPVADASRVLLNVVSSVRPAGTGALLDTRVDAEARTRGGVEGVRECTSTGRLEALLAEEVRKRVGVSPTGQDSSGTSASDSQSPMKYSS